jgi:hypothetical protein
MKKYLIIASSLVIIGLIVVGVGSSKVKADTTSNLLSGWAWSSNIGWINFSGTASDNVSTYGVSVDNTSGLFSGYAWSSNIGWISFYPNDCGSQPVVNLHSGAVTGWALALAGDGRTDGWNGCIELSGPEHTSPDSSGNQGVTMDTLTGIFNGYAWGGDVVGWINFMPTMANGTTIINPVTCENNCGPGVPAISASCSVSQPDTSSRNVTFSASVHGDGTAPYGYTWYTGETNSDGNPVYTSLESSNSSVTWPYTYSNTTLPGTYTSTVIVQDSASHFSASVPCDGYVTIAGSAAQNLSVLLAQAIGQDPNTFNYLPTIQISQGTPFAVKWGIPDGYVDCLSSITSSKTIPSSWGWNIVTGNDGSYSQGSGLNNPLPLTTNTAAAGTYKFGLSCTDPNYLTDGGTQYPSASATLLLSSSNIHEQ